MKDEIKEIKIGMYSTDEILEFMTDGEGRGFMGRSMYDAILDYITNLQENYDRIYNENCKLREHNETQTINRLRIQVSAAEEVAIELQKRIDKVLKKIKEYIDPDWVLVETKFVNELAEILKGDN